MPATARLPLLCLNRVAAPLCDWLVPGLLRDKCIALLKLLPKSERRLLVPIPDTVDAMLPDIAPQERPLLAVMAEWLRRHRRLQIEPADWPLDGLEEFYRMRFEILDENDGGWILGRRRILHADAGQEETGHDRCDGVHGDTPRFSVQNRAREPRPTR